MPFEVSDINKLVVWISNCALATTRTALYINVSNAVISIWQEVVWIWQIPLKKKVKNIVKYKTGKFGEFRSYLCGAIVATMWENAFEKMAIEITITLNHCNN